MKGKEPSAFRVDDYADYVKRSRMMVREFGLKPGERAVVANGRVSFSCAHMFVLMTLSRFLVDWSFQRKRRGIPSTRLWNIGAI